jgi:signal transduction histidine kinase
MSWPILTMRIEVEADIVAVRQRARELASALGFERQDQTRIATAVSEIARNAFNYAGAGRVEYLLDAMESPQILIIRVIDAGPGIADLDAILEGRYLSPQGMGLGITGARRLLDRFRIESSSDGTRVELAQRLPVRAPRVTQQRLQQIVDQVRGQPGQDPLAVLREQNTELLASLAEIRRREEEAAQLTRELGDTNRGVVALTAELDERAEQLRQASEIKSRFLSNMSHEFRTPLNSIMALSRLLLDRIDGQLTEEQEKQIGYIRKSADELLELVNDLLDLAKVEAGKIDVRPVRFAAADLLAGLRGALKPLRADSAVALVFESAAGLPELFNDESKITQILRNFISNALKFTEQGEVHVSTHFDARTGTMTFAVRDTGIGIAPENHERIFDDFTQIESPLQKAAKGTGLGLPLSRRLAELMHGEAWVDSELGAGSTFYLAVPARYAAADVGEEAALPARRKRVLVVDDDERFRYVLRQIIGQDEHYELIEAVDGEQGLEIVRADAPDIIVLDLQMPRLDGYGMLERLDASGRPPLPVIISTSLKLDESALRRLPPNATILAKQSISRERVLALLQAASGL